MKKDEVISILATSARPREPKSRTRYDEAVKMAIEALKQPEQKWIPCSERLPEFMEPVLTWDGACYCVEKRIPYITDTDGEHIKSDWWVSDDYDADNSEYFPNLRDGACIAWRTLPEPYREGSND